MRAMRHDCCGPGLVFKTDHDDEEDLDESPMERLCGRSELFPDTLCRAAEASAHSSVSLLRPSYKPPSRPRSVWVLLPPSAPLVLETRQNRLFKKI